MNKQSNTYTIIYIIVLVVVVGAALAFTAMTLRPLQQENADVDKMKQILASVGVVPDDGKVSDEFNKYIVESFVVNAKGQRVDGNAFDVNVEKMSKESDSSKRELPVYVCDLKGERKYILPVYGAGLWGPIWGYVSINSDGTTVYGAYFAHQGETPGLGAEIEKPEFSNQFKGKRLWIDGKFQPIEVVKAGQKPANGADYVDGVSGGTITSKGVGAMLDNCLAPYKTYLETLRTK
ncbi:MAG: NADH:ubiquinone reductase (Na(+)-transporting) subunit C [Muribaculaceae bacterium]|nr:NADH:ubiquinone reductase (Na(+)-transporting) subunit C [Muribaculaceae bacterium]